MRKVDCEKAQEWIVSDLDLTLDQDLRHRLNQHLATCQSCREAKIAYHDLWASLAGDMPEDPGEAFWNDYRVSLRAKLDAVPVRCSGAWSSWLFTWKAAALFVPAMIALLLVFLGSWKDATRQPRVDDASRHRLLLELNEVYGPTLEEVLPAAFLDRFPAELLHSKIMGTSYPVPRWFEVEDEPSLPHLE